MYVYEKVGEMRILGERVTIVKEYFGSHRDRFDLCFCTNFDENKQTGTSFMVMKEYGMLLLNNLTHPSPSYFKKIDFVQEIKQLYDLYVKYGSKSFPFIMYSDKKGYMIQCVNKKKKSMSTFIMVQNKNGEYTFKKTSTQHGLYRRYQLMQKLRQLQQS